MVLTEFHPRPEMALCDGHQALTMPELDYYLADIETVRKCYTRRIELAQQALFKKWHAPGQEA